MVASNAEAHLRSRLRLGNLYPRDALDETLRVAQRCTFSLDELRYEYPGEIVPEGQTPANYLREQAYIGAHWRYPHTIPDNVQAQLEYELDLIGDMQYEPYFLTVFDIVRFARSQKILCQGRGSAANSAVCYCLGITEVNPSRGPLLFERFISRERDEPPDIDVDFEHQRREEVIQYIYCKYGRMRAALTAVVISYRPRSVLRDVGRALGVDLSVVDKVAKASHSWEASLEPMADGRLAVRLGLNNIKGMVKEAAWRIEEARAAAPFKNTRDVAMRAQLDAGEMKALASANALVTLTGNRRMAMWDAAASVPERDLMRATTIAEPVLELAPPTEADDIVADYRYVGLTLGRHPLALLRQRLNKMRFVPSDILNTFSDGQLARGCGIVTVRQRPETAKGVIFLTLEDEFGTINIIVWPTLVEKQRAELMNASLLGVYGIWQSKSRVRNLIAKRLVDCSHLLGQLDTRSRNFH